MKSAAILVSLISSIAFVAAVPAQLVERNMFRGDAQAAAYCKYSLRNTFICCLTILSLVLTNQPTGNNIVVAALTSDGHVVCHTALTAATTGCSCYFQSYKHAMSTRGLGAHVTGSTAADPLMSQGAIQASVSGQILAAVNVSSTIDMIMFASNLSTFDRLVPAPSLCSLSTPVTLR